MSRPADHNDEIRELIRRGLEGELTAEDRRLLEERPEIAIELEDILRTRTALVGAVNRVDLPEGLAARVREMTIDAPERPIEPTGEVSDRQEKSSGNGSFWLYSMVASLLFALVIWSAVGLFDDDVQSGAREDRPIASGDTGAVAPRNDQPVGDILQIGMTDHMRCAVTFFSGDVAPEPMEKMKAGVGEEFEALIPIVEEGIDRARLIVAHRCSFEGREYVHLVLKGEGDILVSVAVTRRLDGERLQDRTDADTIVDGRSIFRTEFDGFEIAGFESGEHLIFVASNLSVADNLRAISTIVGGIDRMLAL